MVSSSEGSRCLYWTHFHEAGSWWFSSRWLGTQHSARMVGPNLWWVCSFLCVWTGKICNWEDLCKKSTVQPLVASGINGAVQGWGRGRRRRRSTVCGCNENFGCLPVNWPSGWSSWTQGRNYLEHWYSWRETNWTVGVNHVVNGSRKKVTTKKQRYNDTMQSFNVGKFIQHLHCTNTAYNGNSFNHC